MNKRKMTIWGRKFNLNVIIQTFSDEEPIETQIEALDSFKDVYIDKAKESIERYIIKHNEKELSGKSIDNIFKYVVPKALYVPWVEHKTMIALLCHYKFDQEHGIAIVFEDNKLKEIGGEDTIL